VQHGLDPLDPADATLDSDGDGIPNVDECYCGLDPHSPDDYELYAWDDLDWKIKQMAIDHSRGGFPGFLEHDPPNYYLEAEEETIPKSEIVQASPIDYFKQGDTVDTETGLLSERCIELAVENPYSFLNGEPLYELQYFDPQSLVYRYHHYGIPAVDYGMLSADFHPSLRTDSYQRGNYDLLDSDTVARAILSESEGWYYRVQLSGLQSDEQFVGQVENNFERYCLEERGWDSLQWYQKYTLEMGGSYYYDYWDDERWEYLSHIDDEVAVLNDWNPGSYRRFESLGRPRADGTGGLAV